MFITSVAILGLHAEPVFIEADITFGLPAFFIVGLPDEAVKESKERIRSAIKHTDISFPRTHLTINLAPADVKKHGPLFDLGIALSILLAQGEIPSESVQGSLFIGELGLRGDIRRVRGVLVAADMAKERGFKRLFVPVENVEEALLVEGVDILPVSCLKELIEELNGIKRITPVKKEKSHSSEIVPVYPLDLSDIKGQDHAKRGLEIAASGSHNMLLSGPPGAGKTLLARALPSILPRLTMQEALEITKICSVAGELPPDQGCVKLRPFRSPHHSSSAVSLIGGGTWPRPGEVSLAHRGVLFLDELPEFGRHALEHLRQPIEDGYVTISRASATFRFPAKFLLIAAMNPCPCGYATDPFHPCSCTARQISTYGRKISGPLLDRMDLCIPLPRVSVDKLIGLQIGPSSVDIRKRVQSARDRQENRFKQTGIVTNAEMTPRLIREHCVLDQTSERLMRGAIDKLHLSARAYTRILKIGRTIADLEESEAILPEHISEALTYRPDIETRM